MTVKFDAVIDELSANHKRMTESFEASQSVARQARAKALEARDALIAFRNKYKAFLKAIEAGELTVPEDDE